MNMMIMKVECDTKMMTNWCGKREQAELCKKNVL